jgi:hypothetical protein
VNVDCSKVVGGGRRRNLSQCNRRWGCRRGRRRELQEGGVKEEEQSPWGSVCIAQEVHGRPCMGGAHTWGATIHERWSEQELSRGLRRR